MGFYNLNPEQMRELQSPDPGKLLRRDGSNIASVLGQMSSHSPEIKKRVESYLGTVVPGVVGVQAKNIGPKETLEFRQKIAGSPSPWHFYPSNMSDGTLRALGVLVAIFQSTNGTKVPLVAIEEPEVALHPAAAGVLRDSLRAATRSTQLLVTSHSPDLLDDSSFEPESLLAVAASDGATTIGRLDDAGLKALKSHLYTAGELLRMDQLKPTPDALFQAERSPSLFENQG
jgi:predicted ATPase